MQINIRHNGIKPDNVVAECESKTVGGAGDRKFILSGWAKDETQARYYLLMQARALRDELNLEIEHMVDQIIRTKTAAPKAGD